MGFSNNSTFSFELNFCSSFYTPVILEITLKKKNNIKAFSLIEIIIVTSLITLLMSIATPYYLKYRDFYKFQEYASGMEFAIRKAKITAMERSTNIGICVDNDYLLTVRNISTSRGAGICSGEVLYKIEIEGQYRNFIKIKGSGFSFDPRGLTIFPGNSCIQDRKYYVLICVSLFGAIRVDKGEGPCPQTCPRE